ncbi:cupin domain-containing protein [Georgenia subflava]|uniref:Zinc-finger domain-containing protein n=1 Tax=Georgenia subflava TaxID=1622177 RepID=A0A6N7EJV0_9MICO|nr:hypothetical protein [Georgenia subflava]MPV37358.1 hypothetical protein [Georgenia subflava]
MTTEPHAWHAGEELVARYVAGRTDAVVSASVEQHLLGCATCRATIAATSPGGLEDTWAAVVERVQAPTPWLERVLTRLGLPETDALLITAAPAMRRSWLTGTLLVLLFVIAAAAFAGSRGTWLFLVVAPLVPVCGVAVAYGPDADDSYETSLATAYPRVRLVLLRTLAVVATSLPVAAVGAAVLPGPGWTAVAWLLPTAACIGLTLAASTWVRPSIAAAGVAVVWVATAGAVGRGFHTPLDVITPSLLSVYAALAVAAAAVFWMRSDHLALLGRTP